MTDSQAGINSTKYVVPQQE